jgi:hypothetical protein
MVGVAASRGAQQAGSGAEPGDPSPTLQWYSIAALQHAGPECRVAGPAAGRPSRARQRCEDRPRLRARGQRYDATLRGMCLPWSELPVRWNVQNVLFSEFRREFEGL